MKKASITAQLRISFIPIYLLILLSILTTGCNKNSADKQNISSDYYPTNGWKSSTPEEQGIDSVKLLRAIKPLTQDNAVNLHSLLIIRNGYIIAEYYAPLHNKDTLHNLYSATNSFTSTLVGIAVTQKKLNVNDKVLSFFLDQDFENMNRWKWEMSVKDLLTMSSGLECQEFWWNEYWAFENPWIMSLNSENWTKDILDGRMISKPGTLFNFNSGNSHILSEITSKAMGENLSVYTEKNLFSSLGISHYNWFKDPQGIQIGGSGLQLRTRDMAKLGQLYLNQGMWDGKQILSKKWIKEASTNYYPKGDLGYGYQFGVNSNNYYAGGYGGQTISIFPKENIVLAVTGDFSYPQRDKGNKAWDAFFNNGLKAIISNNSLPENSEGYNKLKKYLVDFGKERPFTTQLPPSIKNIVGKTILFDQNQSKITSLTILNIDNNEIEFKISAFDTSDQTEKSAIYRAGTNHTYIENGYRYPLSTTFYMPMLAAMSPNYKDLAVFIRGTFPDDKSLRLNYMIPGSVVSGYLTIEISENGPLLWVSKGMGMRQRINGRID